MTLVSPLPLSSERTARPAIRPKHSASLIVVDRSGAEPRVLMGRRHASHRFMPDVFVFPGGRVDRADHRATFTESFDERMRRLLIAASAKTPPRLPDALLACALREADEEAGLVFRDGSTGRYQAPGVRFVARAVTPSGLPRRFDTRFFMIDRSAAITEVSGRAGPDKELTELSGFPMRRLCNRKFQASRIQFLWGFARPCSTRVTAVQFPSIGICAASAS